MAIILYWSRSGSSWSMMFFLSSHASNLNEPEFANSSGASRAASSYRPRSRSSRTMRSCSKRRTRTLRVLNLLKTRKSSDDDIHFENAGYPSCFQGLVVLSPASDSTRPNSKSVCDRLVLIITVQLCEKIVEVNVIVSAPSA